MGNTDTGSSSLRDTSGSRELLLSDYKYLCDCFWKNEELGERRVTILTTLVAAVMAAIVGLAKEQSPYIEAASVFAASGLAVIGFMTLLRILKRNEATDGYKKDMDEIRRRIGRHLDAGGILEGYRPFRGSWSGKPSARRLGGLSHFVAALNGIVVSAILIMTAHKNQNLESMPVAALGILLFALTFILQCWYIGARDRGSKARLNPTHAGGVVYKIVDGAPRYLVLTAKHKPAEWVLPKGHVEEGESPKSAAERETAEEAGVNARAIAPIDIISFRADTEQVNVGFYLMEYVEDKARDVDEGRSIRWCTLKEAQSLLTFNNTRRVVRRASSMLRHEKSRTEST